MLCLRPLYPQVAAHARALVDRFEDDMYTVGVLAFDLLQICSGRRIGGSVINKYDPPVRVGLPQDAMQRCVQMTLTLPKIWDPMRDDKGSAITREIHLGPPPF